MRDAQPRTIFLKDYTPPAFRIKRTRLHFELSDQHAVVSAELGFERTGDVADDAPLELNGVDLETLEVLLDDAPVPESSITYGDELLRIAGVPDVGVLKTRVRIHPDSNTSLEGLYRSRGLFCTQCEAEGFRKITWFPDRPDVMSTYEVTIDADASACPKLLSNGNLVRQERLADGRHRAVWEDPFPKPSYLFALVAGDLKRVEDHFVTVSGRVVRLVILVEEKDLDKTSHAMESLKRAMRWDEERFGREYDLDVFHIVAVDDFNMGAMENKSLNIFNTSCVLASPDTTTDIGYQRIESIVGHEYFHNWSGNRVTCRDWFQLSLKEGFTVFRDAEFSADLGSAALKRVEDAGVMRTLQFAEDAGPMAHPVRPASFIEISNFYTLTVYEKGAEVVRMLQTLLGREAFRAGSDLYFERHDGQAVTCDDFIDAMADASNRDLSQFRRWYSQAGTPELTVRGDWDADGGVFTLHLEQSTPPTPGQDEKEPLVIPVAVGLLGAAGNLRIDVEGEEAPGESADNTHRVLILDQERQSYRFRGLPERPVPSLLRGFSAPVRVDYPYEREELLALASRDDDGFVRWDAMQKLLVLELKKPAAEGDASLDPLIEQCFQAVMTNPADPAIAADMLRLPSETYLSELAGHEGAIDPLAIHHRREALRRSVARALADDWRALFESQRVEDAYAPVGEQIGRRALSGVALDYWMSSGRDSGELAAAVYRSSDNLTERLVALRCLSREADDAQTDELLEDFFARFGGETLAVNHWLQVQAENPRGDALARVQGLQEHPAYDRANPNKIRALVGTFANANAVGFHRTDGAGYRFLGAVIEELNERNPQIAARLLTPLTRWRKYPVAGALMREELERLAGLKALSRDVYEVISKSLAEV